MAKASVIQKTEKDEIPTEFAYLVKLTEKSTCDRWRRVGREHRLMTDEEIACFLLGCYEKKAGAASVGGICTTCHSLLKLSCLNCGHVSALVTSETTPVICRPSEAPVIPDADDDNAVAVVSDDAVDDGCEVTFQELKESNPNQGRNLRPRRRINPTSPKGRQGASKCRKPAPTEANGCPEQSMNTIQSTSSETSEPAEHQFHPVTELSAETSQRLGDQSVAVKAEDESSCEPKDSEETGDSKENSESLAPPERRHAGRGRPRKYPHIPLECSVCQRKLSTRIAVVNHMKKKHPDTKLPELFDAVATASSKKRPAQGRVKTEAEADGTEGEADGSSEDSQPQKRYVSEAMKQLRKAELKSLKCATCGAQFEQKRQMYTHRRLCVTKVCHLCGRSVKQLEMHLKRHTSARRFPCPHCPKSFLFRNYLEQHMLYHNNERPYCCEICGMRYREKTRLNAHIRTHTGSKPFKCKLCEAAFTRPRGLNDHMRVHTGEKPYSCQVCGRQFSSSGNLAAHRRKVHGLQPQVPNRMTRKLFEVDGLPPGLGDNLEVKGDNPETDRSCDPGQVKTEGVNSNILVCCEAVCSSADASHSVISTSPDPAEGASVCVSDKQSFDAPVLVSSPLRESFLVNSAHVGTTAPTSTGVPRPVLVGGITVSAGVLVSATIPLGVPSRAAVPLSTGDSVTRPTVFVSSDDAVSPANVVHAVPASNAGVPVSVGVSVSDCVPASEGVPVCISIPVHTGSVESPHLPVSPCLSNNAADSFPEVGLNL